MGWVVSEFTFVVVGFKLTPNGNASSLPMLTMNTHTHTQMEKIVENGKKKVEENFCQMNCALPCFVFLFLLSSQMYSLTPPPPHSNRGQNNNKKLLFIYYGFSFFFVRYFLNKKKNNGGFLLLLFLFVVFSKKKKRWAVCVCVCG